MARTGRPTSLTPAVHEAIVDALAKGNYRQTAAAAAGVHRNRMAEWEKRGDLAEQHIAVCCVDDCAECKRGEPYAAFMVDMQAAEAKAEMDLIAEIRNASPAVTGVQGADVWQAKAWIAERRYAQRWAGRVKQQTAEAVDALTDKLKADPELHRKVVDVLTTETGAATGAH